MKILALLVIVISAVTFAQPQTFRSMSTSGLILDDLDRWFSGMLFTQPVPDRLLEVAGIRVYTGLSNLSTGTDLVFDETADTRGSFLLGGSYVPLEASFGLGILTEFMNERFFDEITLLGAGGIPYVSGEGTVEGTWSEYIDTNGDGTLDSRHTVHETAEARIDSSLTSAGVYGAYEVSETLRLGLGVSYSTTSTEVLDEDDNRSLSIADSNLVTGAQTYTLDSSGEGFSKDDRSSIEIAVSATSAVSDMMDIGGMFLFASLSSDISYEAGLSGTEDFLPGEIGVYDIATWSESENYSVSPGGSRFGGGLNMDLRLDESWTLEASGGYYTASLSGSSDQYSISMDSSYIVSIASLIDSTIFDMNGSGGTDIDITNDLFAFGAKLTLDPSEMFTISMGMGFSMFDLSNTVHNASSNNLVETYSDGDDEFADPDDYVSTTTWSQTDETITTESITRISIPVGLEFEVLPKVYARLGASPGFVWESETETTSLIEASPIVSHIVYGDGTEQQFVESPFETIDGTLIETDDNYTEIPYSYGVGYTPNDFIQIDLMGLGDSLNQWRLSATLSF
ncbi:MAG: hypothetical protein KAR44_00670 [Candidatus Aegiribacteria sp.]|nr:hypothetical protein [Candidatus Aegiribacteria sp.]